MKTAAFMQPAYTGRHKVQIDEVLVPIHANPPISTRQVTYETGLSQGNTAYTE
jgi:hypothetical protein